MKEYITTMVVHGFEDRPPVTEDMMRKYDFGIKETERSDIYSAMRKAVEMADDGAVPMLAHRMRGEQLLITMRFDDFVKMFIGGGEYT